MTIILHKEEQCEVGGCGDGRGQRKKKLNIKVCRSVDIIVSTNIPVSDYLCIMVNIIKKAFGDS